MLVLSLQLHLMASHPSFPDIVHPFSIPISWGGSRPLLVRGHHEAARNGGFPSAPRFAHGVVAYTHLVDNLYAMRRLCYDAEV